MLRPSRPPAAQYISPDRNEFSQLHFPCVALQLAAEVCSAKLHKTYLLFLFLMLGMLGLSYRHRCSCLPLTDEKE